MADAAELCRARELAVKTDCVSGSLKDQLLPYASNWGADLTVIGKSAENLLLRKIFGETARHAIRNAERPLVSSQ